MQQDNIYALLIDNSGKILWRSEGVANDVSLRLLKGVIAKVGKGGD